MSWTVPWEVFGIVMGGYVACGVHGDVWIQCIRKVVREASDSRARLRKLLRVQNKQFDINNLQQHSDKQFRYGTLERMAYVDHLNSEKKIEDVACPSRDEVTCMLSLKT